MTTASLLTLSAVERFTGLGKGGESCGARFEPWPFSAVAVVTCSPMLQVAFVVIELKQREIEMKQREHRERRAFALIIGRQGALGVREQKRPLYGRPIAIASECSRLTWRRDDDVSSRRWITTRAALLLPAMVILPPLRWTTPALFRWLATPSCVTHRNVCHNLECMLRRRSLPLLGCRQAVSGLARSLTCSGVRVIDWG